MQKNLEREAPPDLGLGTAEAPDKDKPNPFEVSAKEMEPKAKAGVDLSKMVLKIIIGSIVGLLLLLLLLVLLASADVDKAYRHALLKAHSENLGLKGMDLLVGDLRQSLVNPQLSQSRESVENQQQVSAAVAAMPNVGQEEKAALLACKPMPTGDSRAAIIGRCISTLLAIKEALSTTEDAQIAAAAVDKILVHRQSIFAFWTQVAQMILLNLLLPLLTALFGYIFASQQAGRTD